MVGSAGSDRLARQYSKSPARACTWGNLPGTPKPRTVVADEVPHPDAEFLDDVSGYRR